MKLIRNIFTCILIVSTFSCREDHQTSISSDKNVRRNDSSIKIVKTNKNFVFDEAGILDMRQQKYLSDTLNEFYLRSGIEIYCITKKNLKPFKTDIEYSRFLMRSYDKKRSKTLVLVILFIENRKVYIKTNSRSIDIYPDTECKEIIDYLMVPNFKKGNYFEGLKLGIDKLVKNK